MDRYRSCIYQYVPTLPRYTRSKYKTRSKTKQLNASIVGSIINPMDPQDWWILFYPVVSDHRSSQGSQLLLLNPVYCPFHSVLHQKLIIIRDYTKMNPSQEGTNIYLFDESLYTTWEKPIFYL